MGGLRSQNLRWLVIITALSLAGAWAALSQPLWGKYFADATAYREHGRAAARAIYLELAASGEAASSGRLGVGNLVYAIGPPDVSTEAVISYHWRGAPETPPADSPVGLVTVVTDEGIFGLTYRLSIDAGRLDHLRLLVKRASATATSQPTHHNLGADLRLLVGSVRGYWQGFFGYLDTPTGLIRALIGLPALLPLALTGAILAIVP